MDEKPRPFPLDQLLRPHQLHASHMLSAGAKKRTGLIKMNRGTRAVFGKKLDHVESMGQTFTCELNREREEVRRKERGKERIETNLLEKVQDKRVT